jgi:uncharacterized protein
MSSTPKSKPSAGYADNKKAPLSTSMPESISLDKWADTGYEWTGEVEPSAFKRLAATLATEHEQADISLNANLTCQRCLQPVVIGLSDDYNIALLEDESQARSINDEQDYLLLDEIITEPAPELLLPFKKLVEDEILLKTPMSPKHDDCEMTVEQFGEIPEEEESENPFAALASLKGKL